MQDAHVVDAAVAVLCTRAVSGSACFACETKEISVDLSLRPSKGCRHLLALAHLRDAPANKEGPAEKSYEGTPALCSDAMVPLVTPAFAHYRLA